MCFLLFLPKKAEVLPLSLFVCVCVLSKANNSYSNNQRGGGGLGLSKKVYAKGFQSIVNRRQSSNKNKN